MARTKAEVHIGFLRRVQVLMAIGAALAVAAFYLVIYQPQSRQAMQLADRIVSQQKELSAETATAQNLPMVEAQVKSLNDHMAGLKRVPTQPDIGDFIRDINQLSQESSLTKLDVQPGAARQSAIYDERPVKLTFQGDFAGVFQFLQGVEGLQRLTRVQSVKLHGVTGKAGVVAAEVTVCIYYHDT